MENSIDEPIKTDLPTRPGYFSSSTYYVFAESENHVLSFKPTAHVSDVLVLTLRIRVELPDDRKGNPEFEKTLHPTALGLFPQFQLLKRDKAHSSRPFSCKVFLLGDGFADYYSGGYKKTSALASDFLLDSLPAKMPLQKKGDILLVLNEIQLRAFSYAFSHAPKCQNGFELD